MMIIRWYVRVHCQFSAKSPATEYTKLLAHAKQKIHECSWVVIITTYISTTNIWHFIDLAFSVACRTDPEATDVGII